MVTKMALMKESPKAKMMLWIGGLIFGIVTMICAVFWLARAESARKFDNDAYISDWKDDRSAFDMCMGFRGVSQDRIDDVCGDTPCTRDIQTGWSTAFKFNGVVMLFISLSFFMSSCGAFRIMPRVCGSMCLRCWLWTLVPCLVFTAIVMWGRLGRLCADVEIESNYKGDGLFVEGWTFKSDRAAMTGFWFVQSGMLIGMC